MPSFCFATTGGYGNTVIVVLHVRFILDSWLQMELEFNAFYMTFIIILNNISAGSLLLRISIVIHRSNLSTA